MLSFLVSEDRLEEVVSSRLFNIVPSDVDQAILSIILYSSRNDNTKPVNMTANVVSNG